MVLPIQLRMPELANTEQWINYYNDITLESSGRLAIQPEEKAKYLNNTKIGSLPECRLDANIV
ncbi:hypothetical protein [Bacteroides thetaiotaomicron]|uniref:hypothetical protein n=1 Tax=Bacteroides thetaiotaomicron TaxID=818 RepID=UPI0021656120|nr:hypothetical protein [Bacteroides thetaiotaomicron]MCS2207903.1 hypothetical protein [Bacteroides thetaiotaomicron]